MQWESGARGLVAKRSSGVPLSGASPLSRTRDVRRASFRRNLAFVGVLTVLGCSSASSEWDVPLGDPEPVGLSGSVVVRDDAMNRMLFLTSPRENELTVEVVGAGRNVAATVASADLNRLFVLSRGVFPRRTEEDEGPRLSVYDGSPDPDGARLLKEFALDDPKERLALDPRGEWVAAFGGDSTVVNPNELVLFNLDEGDGTEGTAQSKTIRSFGGAPVELVFTEELTVPVGGARRLLAVRTDRDVTLVDLANLEDSELTIKLPQGANGVALTPQQIVYDDGDPDDATDARIAIRLAGTSDVVIVELGEPSVEGRDFSPVLNIVDVGDVPSAIDFVRTDGGLRLAALVPGSAKAVLVSPETTRAEVIQLPGGYSQMRRITSEVSQADGGDVALLWGNSPNIAFWSLGSTSSTPHRSVDTAALSFPVAEVLDVPEPNSHLKVLRGPSSDLFVLDLNARQSFPLNTSFTGGRVHVAPDGRRLWVYQADQQNFSSVELEDLHPRALYVDLGVTGVFDVLRGDGGRSAIALHTSRGWHATVFDAEDPHSAKTAHFPSLQLSGFE